MKIQITLKDPNGLDYAVDDVVREADNGLTREEVWNDLKRWIKYREYVTIEFDTELGTATVIERKDA